jgi:deazaflavin-dependent oxidoreductase (nitroreductase family)
MASPQSIDHEARQTTAVAADKRPGGMSIFQRYLHPLVGTINPRIMALAGARWSPTVSILKHRGHKSGRTYSTPISALPHDGFFWMGLAFGEDAGWARNVVAAGECELRYRGRDYRLVEPIVVDASTARAQLPLMLRIAGPVVGIHKVLRMRALQA